MSPSASLPVASPAEPAPNRDVLFMIVAAILPLTQLIQIRIVGTVLLQDLLDPVVLGMLLSTGASTQRLHQVKTVLLLATVWLLGQVVTDLYRNTVLADLARGWSRIVLLMVHIATLWLLSGGRIKIIAPYMFSSGVAAILSALLLPSDFAEADIWKFGVGGGLLLIVSAVGAIPWMTSRLHGLLPSVLVALVGIVSLARDSRSLFAICTLSAVYAGVAAVVSRSERLVRYITPLSFALFVVLGLLFAQALVTVYGNLAAGGYLGFEAQLKYAIQGSGGNSLFLAGRSESLVSIEAIKDSPILGHGSWAQDPYYIRLYFARLAELGLPTPIDYYIATFGYTIPSHSYLFGAWVEAGILGVPIWVWMAVVTVQSLYAILRQHRVPSILVTTAAFTLLWDIPFSPFGTNARFTVAAQICIILAALNALRQSSAERRGEQGRTTPVR